MANSVKPAGVLILMLFLFAACTSVRLRTANELYEEYYYTDAIMRYEKVLKKKLIPEAMIRIADCYRLTDYPERAEAWYAKVVNLPGSTPLQKLHYAELLMQNKKYEDAGRWFESYLQNVRNDSRAERLKSACDSIEKFYRDTLMYSVSLLKFSHSIANGYSPAFYRNGIVYVSDNLFEENRNARSQWTGKPCTDLVYAKRTDIGNWIDAEPLRGEINGTFNEGPAAFNKEGNIIYFTRNSYNNTKVARSRKNINELKIYSGALRGNQWYIVNELPFNSNEYSTGHPALNADGTVIYFTSDRPWGYGGADLYRVRWINGSWTAPENLGTEINTAGNEMFPFILNDSILYFASDAWQGLGGFDIYETIYDGDHWSEPRNLGYPVNTSRDDFGYILDSLQQFGFFTSNRVGLTDRIFQFTKNPPLLKVSGAISDTSGKFLANSIVQLKASGKIVETVTTSGDGNFSFNLKPGISYTVIVRNPNYFSQTSAISTLGKRYSENFILNFTLDKVQPNVTLNWEGIYFPKKTLAITDEAAKEIERLAGWLILNPYLQVEIHSHTDARGSDADNLVLSQKRAEVVAKSLLSNKEIQPSRIKTRGFGESRLLNNCVDGILCLEEDHRVNNRIEIKVTGILP